jgi:NodT family efflux transporter outer membrane factor (OMF) lipoprotein
MWTRTFLLLGTALCLQACDLAPEYHPPKVATPAAFKEGGTEWRQAAPADNALRGAWWQRFGDPELNRLEDQVESANPSLAAAVARYDQARALAAEGEAGLLPSFLGGGAFNRNRQSDRRPLRGATQPSLYDSETLSGTLAYEFDFWGRLRNTATSGEATAQASAADLATARLGLQAELAGDYMSLRGLDQRGKLLRDTVTNYSRALELTQSRFAGNIASGLDVARAQTQLHTAEAAVAESDSRRALMEHAIAALVGQPASSFSLPVSTQDLVLPVVPAALPSTLLQRRADIAGAERRVAAANAGIGVAKAAFYPQVVFAANAGFQSTDYVNLLSMPNGIWTLGPNISLPIFNGGRLTDEEARSYARQREAGADYQRLVLAAFRDVEDNLALINYLGVEAQDEAAALASATKTTTIATNLYRDGAASYLDVVTAQTAELQVELAGLDIKTRRWQSSLGLIRALGGGWDAGDLPQGDAITALSPNKLVE